MTGLLRLITATLIRMQICIICCVYSQTGAQRWQKYCLLTVAATPTSPYGNKVCVRHNLLFIISTKCRWDSTFLSKIVILALLLNLTVRVRQQVVKRKTCDEGPRPDSNSNWCGCKSATIMPKGTFISFSFQRLVPFLFLWIICRYVTPSFIIPYSLLSLSCLKSGIFALHKQPINWNF